MEEIGAFIVKCTGIFISAGVGGFIGSLIVELIKSRLSKKNKEHEVIFTKYHERQSVVLADLYAKLSVMVRNITSYIMPSADYKADNTNHNNFEQVVMDSISDFKHYSNDNEIFIPEEIRSIVYLIQQAIDETVGKAWSQLPFKKNITKTDSIKKYASKLKTIQTLHDKAKDDFKYLRTKLDVEIKKVLYPKA